MIMSSHPIKRSASWRYLVEAYQVCNQKYAALLSDFQLTPSQLDILFQIETLKSNAKPKAIADGLLVTKGNITSVTKRLLERGLIHQQPDLNDKRSATFSITNEGMLVLKTAKRAAKAFIEVQLAPFSDEEVQIVGELMQKMRNHLESDEFDESIVAIRNTTLDRE